MYDPKYFDNNSTTLIPDTLLQEYTQYLSTGNPSNTNNRYGQNAKNVINTSRNKLSKFFNILPEEIIFNSGATEGNNTIIKSLALYNLKYTNKRTIICNTTEHKCIIESCKYIEKNYPDIKVVYLDLMNDISRTSQYFNDDVFLVICMYVNNETGTIFPIKEIGGLCKKYKIHLHVDSVCLVGKYKLYPKDVNITSFSISAHKFYGLKGIGMLYINLSSQNMICPLIHGGPQEHNIRSGTENVAGIYSLYRGLEYSHTDRDKKNKHLIKLYKTIIDTLNKYKLNYTIIRVDETANQVPYTILLSLLYNEKMCNKKLLEYLTSKGYSLSIGSSCNTNDPKASHVLYPYIKHLPDEEQKQIKRGTIRISLGDNNTIKECKLLIKEIKKYINRNIK
jgi:cysteine desulfurase